MITLTSQLFKCVILFTFWYFYSDIPVVQLHVYILIFLFDFWWCWPSEKLTLVCDSSIVWILQSWSQSWNLKSWDSYDISVKCRSTDRQLVEIRMITNHPLTISVPARGREGAHQLKQLSGWAQEPQASRDWSKDYWVILFWLQSESMETGIWRVEFASWRWGGNMRKKLFWLQLKWFMHDKMR